MKTIKNYFAVLFLVGFMIIGMQQANAQGTAPPPPGGHGASTNSSGGGAPIGSGLFVLLGLVGAYGGFKGYQYLKNDRVVE